MVNATTRSEFLSFQRFQVGDDIGNVAWIKPKFRHNRVRNGMRSGISLCRSRDSRRSWYVQVPILFSLAATVRPCCAQQQHHKCESAPRTRFRPFSPAHRCPECLSSARLSIFAVFRPTVSLTDAASFCRGMCCRLRLPVMERTSPTSAPQKLCDLALSGHRRYFPRRRRKLAVHDRRRSCPTNGRYPL